MTKNNVEKTNNKKANNSARGGVRFALARAIGSVATFGLQKIFHKNGKNTPGKLALYADPLLIEHLSYKVRHSVIVVGTNGKTTVNNLVADVLCESGYSVVCNRDGANLDSGISTALLQSSATRAHPVDWGVFESDELWIIKSLPYLQSDYVLLLNLFRDQLDRCGEIEHIQDVIVQALHKSPHTTLIYNGDDPLCALIARKVNNPSVSFGISIDMHLPQNTVADAQMCQCCEGIMQYAWRSYGQLGIYECPKCGFARPEIDFSVTGVNLGNDLGNSKGDANTDGASMNGANADGATFELEHKGTSWKINTPINAPYMIYNLAGVCTIAMLAGCNESSVQKAISSFAPKNGRLQNMLVRGHETLLNLAKNPTGFNQNLKLVVQGARKAGQAAKKNGCTCVVSFFINDKQADGHDVSWLWDVDFEELSTVENIMVFAGGTRANDMQVRLKYAGIHADIVSGACDLFEKLKERGVKEDVDVYFIANYTSLPQVKTDLERMEKDASRMAGDKKNNASTISHRNARTSNECVIKHDSVSIRACSDARQGTEQERANTPAVVIAHIFPDLLNLYGDAGNITVLKRRLEWRNIPVLVKSVKHGSAINLEEVDLVFLGGGPDREQRMASVALKKLNNDLRTFVENDGVMMAICGGYQILGNTWLCADEEVPGLGILDIETKRAQGGSTNRLIGNIALSCAETTQPVIGFENHAGRTFLNSNTQPFGRVLGGVGNGNNDAPTSTNKQHSDGARYKNVIGTYLHGPLLSKNPEIADHLLQLACDHCAIRHNMQHLPSTGLDEKGALVPLDDSEELAANSTMAKRLHV